jgi:hypothetical protein
LAISNLPGTIIVVPSFNSTTSSISPNNHPVDQVCI